jgi:hypothetical protein
VETDGCGGKRPGEQTSGDENEDEDADEDEVEDEDEDENEGKWRSWWDGDGIGREWMDG